MSHQETASTSSSAFGPPFFPDPFASPGIPAAVTAPVSTTEVREAPPEGYYVTKRGQVKKSNPPTKERREYGLRQVLINEEELKVVRPRTRAQPLDTFVKNPGFKARVRCTMKEIEKINENRKKANNKRLIHLSERVSNDPAFKTKALEAENRRDKFEELKQKGESTRTKRAREELHRAQKGGL